MARTKKDELIRAMADVIEQMDSDLTKMGKGRNLSSVPGFEGQNIVETARAATDE